MNELSHPRMIESVHSQLGSVTSVAINVTGSVTVGAQPLYTYPTGASLPPFSTCVCEWYVTRARKLLPLLLLRSVVVTGRFCVSVFIMAAFGGSDTYSCRARDQFGT